MKGGVKAKEWIRRLERRSGRGRHRAKYVSTSRLAPGFEVHRFVLPNGLVVLFAPDHSAPVVAYQTWFRVGSKHEERGKTGLAHLFEHLMFKETKRRKAGEFDRSLEEVGGDSNAATWTDWTQYHENVPKKALELAMDLESDRMTNLVLNRKQVASEKEVVANERRFRVDDDVDGTASEALYKLAYAKHPYRWPTIGWMRDIKNFTVRDCTSFYRTFYAPNNATLVVVGDADGKELIELIEQYYGPLKRAKIPNRVMPAEPEQHDQRRLQLTLPTPTERLIIGVHVPGFAEFDHAVLIMAHEILLGGRASRVYQSLVVDEQIATDVGGMVAPFQDPGLWEIVVNARPRKRAKQIEKLLVTEIEKMAKEGPTPKELERVRNRLELSFLCGMETAAGKAEQIGFFEIVAGDASTLFRRLEQFERVTAADMKRVISKVFAKHRRNIVHVIAQEAR